MNFEEMMQNVSNSTGQMASMAGSNANLTTDGILGASGQANTLGSQDYQDLANNANTSLTQMTQNIQTQLNQ
ncbi:hypothetical protein QP270_26080, partial [Escherichia coli]|nr:hypothetical protein [Escherichia coli]